MRPGLSSTTCPTRRELHDSALCCILYKVCRADIGAMAQLVAHLHGMERVRGSNPLSSTVRAFREIWKSFFCENGGLNATKTATSNTTQPVSPQLGKLISEACDGKKPTDFIVACSDGTHITPNRLRDHFNAAKVKAGRPDLHFRTPSNRHHRRRRRRSQLEGHGRGSHPCGNTSGSHKLARWPHGDVRGL